SMEFIGAFSASSPRGTIPIWTSAADSESRPAAHEIPPTSPRSAANERNLEGVHRTASRDDLAVLRRCRQKSPDHLESGAPNAFTGRRRGTGSWLFLATRRLPGRA